jgi:hypothetical protein
MAKPKLSIGDRALKLRLKKKTSDGSSIMSRPRSKQAKRGFKKYRGQGR